MDRLRRRDADGRMVREPCRGPTQVGCDPPPRRRVGHEEASASVSSFGGGSRRRTRHGLHHGMALSVAFPSHQKGRTPFAARSPVEATVRRSLGGDRGPGGPLDGNAEPWRSMPADFSTSVPTFFSTAWNPPWYASSGWGFFLESRRARARSYALLTENICR
jgi:hypothetical protein